MDQDGEPLTQGVLCTEYLGFWVRVCCQANVAMVVKSLGLPTGQLAD